jgi:TP901 family phage tail tape measure protein
MLAISTIFTAIDKVSGVTKKIGNNVTAFSKKANRGFQKFQKTTKAVTGGISSLFSKLVIGTAIIAGLTAGVIAFTKAGVDFEKTIDSVAAKFDNISPEQLIRVEEKARELGATTEFSATQAAKGLEFLALAGFNADQSVASLAGVVDLATAANLDLATSTDIATDTLGAFNLMTKDSIQLQTNLSRVNDVMAATVTKSNTSIELLFETFKQAGPIGTSLGASIETIAALSGKLADAGIKGSKAGTDLKNVFVRLAAPTEAASVRLQQLGLQVKDSEGNFRDILDIMGDLQGKIGMKGTVEQAAILNDIFGKIPLASVNILLKTGAENIRGFRTELEGANGAAARMAATMRDNVAGQIKSLQSRFESVRITTFKIMTPLFERGLTSLTKLTAKAEEFLRTNEAIIQAGLERTFQLISKWVGLAKELLAPWVPILQQIFALVGSLFDRFKQAGIIAVVVNLSKQLHSILIFITQEILKFIGFLDKIGAIDFIIQGFTLLLNIIRLIGVFVKPLVKVIFAIGKVLFAVLTPLFKGFGLLFKGINKIFQLVDRGRASKENGETETGLKSPVESLIESRQTTTNREIVDVNFNNAPSGTAISRREQRASRIGLNLGAQGNLSPGM